MAQPSNDHSFPVELYICCHNLVNSHVLAKSDPMVVVYSCTDPNSIDFVEIGRTELISNNDNPKFLTTVKTPYCFEKTQNLQFIVYHVKDEKLPLQNQCFLGKTTCLLGEICGSKGRLVTKPILGPDNETNGFISVQVEDVSLCEDEVVLAFKGSKLAKMDILSESDPYFVLSRISESGSWLDVHKSEVVKDSLTPNWAPFTINVSKLCKNDYDLPLRFKLFDWNLITAHSEMGEFQTYFKQLLDPNSTFTLVHSQMKSKEIGTISCDSKLKTKSSFLRYLSGGLEISLIVGIDFTLSNGTPQNPNSLHYVSGSQMNEYEQAIRSVGEIVSYYDQDKMFPVFGFGAKLPPKYSNVMHCFPLNGNDSQPECFGLDGIMTAYHQAITTVQFNGPTHFAPIINQAIDGYASKHVSQNSQRYFILLMITDGEINDMKETTAAIIRASQFPMSIIIVGVGKADFSSMKALDCDNGLLTHENQVAKREIVQFVPFSKFASNYALLAEETLAEIPHQVTEYFTMKHITPKEPIRIDPFQHIAQMVPVQTQPFNVQPYPPPQQQMQLPYGAPVALPDTQPLGVPQPMQ